VRPSISKITTAKWTGGMAKLVECLLYKHEALISKSQSYQKKKKFRNTDELGTF
jgi:hypothetical protein